VEAVSLFFLSLMPIAIAGAQGVRRSQIDNAQAEE
jgi:hypothetical protein